ncbi:type II secretion system protein [Clostridium thermarum]|uniref:type II secretion system protein n=1 Tax=Clostridium thermarum TaxID=1716543 RepID=UPI00111F6B50|nr:type II secretion system protein [Clostridium thermarum]
MNTKGFTLIELISVIAILAILGAVLAPRIPGYQARAKRSRFQHSARNILHAVQAYNSDKPERVSLNVVSTEKVIDSDKVSDIMSLAVNAESSVAIIKEQGETYDKLKDLTLGQLIGVANSNFSLDSDESIDESTIVEGSINDY